jgi:hypothetical protein
MSSRQEEKEARRQARLEQEAKEAQAASRNRRLQMVLGGVLAVLIVVGVVIGISAAGGDGGGSGPKSATTAVKDNPNVSLPAQQTADAAAASEAAGCTTTSPAIEGSTHENREFTEADYKTNPPTSGNHFPQWAEDGIYDASNTPPLGQLVHTLEHGRIDVQYKPGTSAENIAKLEKLLAENDGYHMLLFENPTNMDAAVAATAWGQSLTCPDITDKTWDALRTFRDDHIDQGPEKVP